MWSVYKPAENFCSDVLHAEFRAATDVYALMFLTDVVDFIIIVFGFWAFGVSEKLKMLLNRTDVVETSLFQKIIK